MIEDRRRWFRCKAPTGSDQAVLRAGEKDLPVKLLDTSASGFSARADGPIEAKTGDCLLMQTITGWVEVRLVHIEPKGGSLHLGLERIREIGDHLPYRLLDHVGGVRGIAALILAMLCGVILGGAVLYITNYW